MNQFKFRLKKVYDLRIRERDKAAESFRQAQLAITKLQEEVANILDEHAKQSVPSTELNQGRVDSQKLLEVGRYQAHLMQQVAQLRSQIAMVEEEAKKRRQIVVEREQAVRSMENLESRQRQEWTAADLQRTQIALDEWSGIRYWGQESK